MNSEDYQYILNTTFKETLEYYNLNLPDVHLQHDNDPNHRSKSTTNLIKENCINVLTDWPPQSPDLNPI